VYNAMPYLEAAVDSVLGQSFQTFEFLIIDDGSTDSSVEYLKSLSDPRIRLIARENRGLGATLNELFRLSRTDYVARMDADDICHPDRLDRQMAFLESHRDVVVVGTGIEFLAGSGVVSAVPRPVEHEQIRRWLLRKRPGLCHPTIVVKRSAWADAGGYRVARSGEDLDFCLRLCDVGRAANLPEAMYVYRLHERSISSTSRDEIQSGYAYAVACARARERAQSEPRYAEFCARWKKRPWWDRLRDILDDVGERYYRRALVLKCGGSFARSAASLIAATACRPHLVFHRLFGF
jgi:glycosyltransferase involved in cell wall biosynthesis